MTESFPDSLDTIQQALELPDLTQRLLEITRDHPRSTTIRDIVIVYSVLVQQSPSQVYKLTATLINLKSATDITILAYNGRGKLEPISIALALDEELHELLGSELARLNTEPISPSNQHLITSLLSAIAVKRSLCYSHAFHDAVHLGLHFNDGARYNYDVAAHQALVLGACLQLSMNGSYFCGPNGFDTCQVLSALEGIKNVGVVKHPGGQRLLEVTIQQAKDGFTSDIEDSWGILFPQ